MLIKAKNIDKNRILEYLRDNYEECLYLYIDISNYSIENETCEVWYKKDGDYFDYIVMKYYSSYQVFSVKRDYLPTEVRDHIINNPVMMISGRRDLIKKIKESVCGYKDTYGFVFELDRKIALTKKRSTEWAGIKDAENIAKLIQMDSDIGAHYERDVLVNQLIDRMKSHTGRSCVIRENGLIVAHTATYAENELVAVISGTVVHPEYRNRNYFLRITTELQGLLAKEGKRTYTFAVSDKMINYHKRLHRVCGEYGKLERQ